MLESDELLQMIESRPAGAPYSTFGTSDNIWFAYVSEGKLYLTGSVLNWCRPCKMDDILVDLENKVRCLRVERTSRGAEGSSYTDWVVIEHPDEEHYSLGLTFEDGEGSWLVGCIVKWGLDDVGIENPWRSFMH